ncbi:MAG: 4'-phosphopantetheinyl transferase family protein, partial [Chlamydiales bacterium]
ARDLLVKNQILAMEDARLTTIQHHASGEPYLLLPKAIQPLLHISISHSRTWCACLISLAAQPASIDLEDLSIQRDVLKLAEHFFSIQECEYVKNFGAEAFYILWTAKEAIAKLRGKGLAEVLKIQLHPASLETNRVNFEGREYRLKRHITQDYLYTIASQGWK